VASFASVYAANRTTIVGAGAAVVIAVAAVIGPQLSAVSGGLLSLVGVGLIALAMPEFRRLDLRAAAAEAGRADAAADDSGAT